MILVHMVEKWFASESLLLLLLLLLPGLKAGFLFSPFGFQSRRCAARCRTHQRPAERRVAPAPGQTELCSAASRPTLPLSALSLSSDHSFSRSFHPVWSSGAACVEMLERVAPLKWTQVKFIFLVVRTFVFNVLCFAPLVVQFYVVFLHHIARFDFTLYLSWRLIQLSRTTEFRPGFRKRAMSKQEIQAENL